ncbi:MAG: WD40 repeat domain-containing protein [Chloroflexi bacterium CFX4]|nr:WD40 repeat domain-containing protein [Chloroflexi bacterium CFX4]MDL1923818.1 WD40 repeat domain-containing protein [Chloroflexi bacterium CFX3]
MFQSIRAQNLQFGEVLRQPISGLCQVAFSPNGEQIAIKRFTDAERQTIELAIFSAKTGEPQSVLHTGNGKCSPEYGAQNTLAWEGRTLAAVFEEGIMVWDAHEGFEQRYTVEGSLFALSTLTERLVTVSLEKRFRENALEPFPSLVLRELDNGRELTRYAIRQADDEDFFSVNWMAWSPRGETLLASDGVMVRLVDVGKQTITVREPTWAAGYALSLADWLDERVVFTGYGTGTVGFWDATSGNQERELYLKSCGLALSPDRRWLVGFDVNDSPDFSDNSAPEQVIKVFALPEVSLIAKLPYEATRVEANPCLQLTFSADGTHLAAIIDESNPTLHVWARRE